MAGTPLLHGEFGSYPARGPRFALTLTPVALHVQRLRPRPEAWPQGGLVPLAEVSGCRTLRSCSPNDSAAYLCVYTYPRSRRGGRRRTARTFRADRASDYKENYAEAQRWATAVTCLLRGVPLPGDLEITPELLPRPPRLLLLVNPFGGRGLAWQWCKNHVLPMISEAGLSFNLIQTERQNHARELVQGLRLSEWDGIVTVSGDGLLYEVVNGLLDRPDWEEAVKIPVGVLPCGSGNALAGAVNQHGGFEPAMGLDLLLNCSLLMCRGGGSPLDLLSVTLASGARCFSFLSVAWGFVSDVDIQSERFRVLGSARFTLGTVLRLASLHVYPGRLSYLPASSPASNGPPALVQSLPRAASELALAPTLAPAPSQGTHSPLHRSVSDLPLTRGADFPLESQPDPSPSPPHSPGPSLLSPDLPLTSGPGSDPASSSLMGSEPLASCSPLVSSDSSAFHNPLVHSGPPVSCSPMVPSDLEASPCLPGSLDIPCSLDSPASEDPGELLAPNLSSSPPCLEPGEGPASPLAPSSLSPSPNSQTSLEPGASPISESPAPGTHHGPKDDLLPPLGSPLPPGWVTLEGDFVLILAQSPSHLGADLVAVPNAQFGDGLVHLCWVRGGVSRASLLRLFLAMERGSHFGLGCPQLGYTTARAFRLEPLTHHGILTVDGEQVEYGPLQAQIHPGLGTLLTGPKAQEPQLAGGEAWGSKCGILPWGGGKA
ncbi:sphingosine kinase 2 [Trichosurus vulpecula]|uniref:sphingosine kinase 2 n=1 Tax=Trichosurus vulpecula TaxID=9337 RepID=UPI00186ADB87|nr:sphingosine kinase 2 [Trichosurus vulpecula]